METDLVSSISKKVIESNHLVIFTGAGISTASGLPDYRGPDGVWTRRDKGLKPKPLKKAWSEFQPNVAHRSIVELQNLGLLKHLISQNVDGLHIKSGIDPGIISELHGNSTLMKCLDCDARYTFEELQWDIDRYGRGYRTQKLIPGQPSCRNCNGRIISSVVNFGDPMPQRESTISYENSVHSDLFIVVGSSLVVNPAASYPRIAKKHGAELIIINKGETPLDHISDLKIEDNIEEILPKIVDKVKEGMA